MSTLRLTPHSLWRVRELKMKRLTLNETWVLCLRMWKWIAEQRKKERRTGVEGLKALWLKKHGYKDDEIDNDCFFCEYACQKQGCLNSCPGYKVDSEFTCDNAEYSYCKHPIKFYTKLVELNKKRKKRIKVKNA